MSGRDGRGLGARAGAQDLGRVVGVARAGAHQEEGADEERTIE